MYKFEGGEKEKDGQREFFFLSLISLSFPLRVRRAIYFLFIFWKITDLAVILSFMSLSISLNISFWFFFSPFSQYM